MSHNMCHSSGALALRLKFGNWDPQFAMELSKLIRGIKCLLEF